MPSERTLRERARNEKDKQAQTDAELLWPVGRFRRKHQDKWPRAAALLSRPSSIKEVSQECAVTRTEVTSWLREPEFLAMVKQAQEEIRKVAAKKAVNAMLDGPKPAGGSGRKRQESVPADSFGSRMRDAK